MSHRDLAKGSRPVERRPLEGVRVLDFSWALAAPFGTMFLALLGAEVIKVESLRRLDSHRRSPSPKLSPEEGADLNTSFAIINLNKRSVRLDLSQPDGVALAREIVRISDVVVENYRPTVLDRLGLGYYVLRRARPDLVMVSCSSLGSAGPESHYAGYASIFAALSGLSYLTGYRDGVPVELRSNVDLTAGEAVAFSALVALWHRHRTGHGQRVDLAAREVVAALVGDQFLELTMNGRVPSRTGNEDAIMAPHNVYRCAGDDRWVSIAVGTEEEWRAFSRAIGQPDLADDPRFADRHRRWQNRQVLDQTVGRWTASRTPWEATELLQRSGVAAFPSVTAADVVEDAHLKERAFLRKIDHPKIGRTTVTALPWKLSGSPEPLYQRTPLFGEHNEYVFGHLLGMSNGDIARLAENGVLR